MRNTGILSKVILWKGFSISLLGTPRDIKGIQVSQIINSTEYF